MSYYTAVASMLFIFLSVRLDLAKLCVLESNSIMLRELFDLDSLLDSKEPLTGSFFAFFEPGLEHSSLLLGRSNP
jgi:hypothetical protein